MPNYSPGIGSAANLSLSNLNPTALNVDLNFNNFKGVNLAVPTLADDAATKDYVDSSIGGAFMQPNFSNSVAATKDQNLGGFKITNLANPAALTDAATKDYVDNFSPLVGASKALDNLALVAINTSLLPNAGTLINLGANASNLHFNNAFLNNVQHLGPQADVFRFQTSGNAANQNSPRIEILTNQGLNAGGGYIFVKTGDIANGAASVQEGYIRLETGENLSTANFASRIFILTGNSVAGGGSISVNTGTCTGAAGSGGGVSITTGALTNSAAAGQPGNFTLTLGGNAGVGQSADILFSSGSLSNAANTNAAGTITLTAGSTNGNGDGGFIFLQAGSSSLGDDGRVVVQGSQRFQVGTLAADPTEDPTNGEIYYNSVTGKFRGRAGGAWVDLH